MDENPDISVIVPFFNEEHSIVELHRRLVAVTQSLGKRFEIIFVDDGSTDGTFEHMRQLTPLRAFRLNHNIGHTKAFAFGLSKARAESLVSLDGDLENLPEDIPKLFEKFQEGYDLVIGWRKNRWEGQFLTRKLPSLVANRFISFVSGMRVHDHGCFLRVYRKSILREFDFHGDSQRMIVPYVFHNNARIAEVEVQYKPRQYGVSKFGLWRIFEVNVDILTFHFFHKYGNRPRHFFSALGFISIFLAFLAFIFMLYLKFGEGKSFIITPMPTVVAIFLMIGMQLILMGLLAEIVVRQINKGKPTEGIIRESVENLT